MSDLQVYHKEIDSLYKNALFLDDVNELISFLATNNFEGVDYIDSKIAKDLSDLTLADEGRMHSLLDILLKVNETAGIFDLSDPNVLYDITFPVLKQLFNIIADENNNLVVLGKVVQLFSKFFSNTDLLNLIHATQSFEGSIQILGRKLPLIGDYISQLNLCECLFILSRSSTSEIWPRIWFSDPKIRSTFLNIDGANFDEDARKTLNVINRMEDNPRVFSYPVKSIMFGTIVLQRPGEDFWVDFNYDTESITFFFLYDEESFWETARVSRLNVNRYMFKDNKKGKTTELIITLNSPCYQIADSVSQNPITESNILTIVFHSVQKIKDHVENIFGSECGDSFPNKDRSSARSNVVPINKYMETDYSEFAQKTNHTGQRKASVCESVLNLETNEADESLSTSNKRKASVCESVLNLEANEADESLSTSNKRKASVCESVLNLEANEAEESVSTLNKRKASSVTIHLQSNKKVSTYLKGREVSNIADDECIPRSGSKNDFKPIFKKSSISRVNIVTVEESCISVEQADELEKHTDASLDQQKHVVIHTPSPTIQKLASEGKTNSLQEGLSASLPHSKFNDDQCSAVEKEISVNLEPDESALKQTNDSFDASNLSPTSEKKSFHFEKADGDSKNVGGENVKNLKVILESNNHPDVSQVGDSSSNKKSSQLLHRPSLSNDPLSNSELTDTAVSNKKKKKKIKKCNANDDVRRKSVEEIFDSHSDNNIDQNTRRSALWARKKSKAMLDFENFTDDEQNFDIQYQPQSSRPNFTISSGKGPTPSKKRTSSLGKCPIPNEKRRSIFHTDTETVSSGHSWLKKKKKLFEPPKRKYSDRKKAIKAVSKIPNQAADVKENTVYDLNNCTRYELDQKNKNIKPKSNELKNKASYRNWSDIENNELFVEKIPSRSCLSKKISRSRLSADSNASVEHPMESAVFEHEEANKRLKYDSDIDFEQYIEDNENSNMKTSLKDSLSKNIPRDMDSDVHKGEKNISDPSRMKCKDSILSRTREEKLFQTPAKGRNSAVVSQPEEIKENEVTLPLKVPSGHQFDSEVEISNRPAKSSLEEFDVAFDEKRGKNMHLKYFLSSLTETSDLAENESGRDYTNNSKKRKSECFNASKRRKKLKIVADRKQKETKTLKHEVLQDGSGPENTTRVLNDKGRSSTKPNLKVKKNKICQDFEVPVDDILTFYESDENKSRIKECHVSSLNQTDTKEHEKRLKSTMKLHSKKIEASTEESDRITHPDIDNLNTKMFKRPSFSSSCSDHKKFKQMETLLSRLSECANYYSRKLIATFQICSRDYYLQSAKMRRHMLHVCECLSKTDDHLTTKDLKKMIKKCQLFRKKVEESLRKLVYLGQEYFEFENKCLLRMKNKNRRAGAKFCYYVAKSCKSASNLLEKKMLSKLNKLQKNFIHEIDGL